MSINIFVGVEGTHSIIRKAIEQFPDTEFGTFYGPNMRKKIDSTWEEIINIVFPDGVVSTTNVNIGMTRRGATGLYVSTLLNKAPVGTTVWFFKSADDAETVNLHTAFLKISDTKGRVERLTGMSEEELVASDAYEQVSLTALDDLNSAATTMGADAWADFDYNIYNSTTGTVPTIKVRRFVKS